MPSVPHRLEEKTSAVSAALLSHPFLSAVGSNPLECGLLHRLDTETSGALAFAKSTADYDRLRHAWKDRSQVRKIYLAIVEPDLRRGQPHELIPRLVEMDLGHSAKSSKRMIALLPPRRLEEIRGKPLQTRTRILRVSPLKAGRFEVEVEIETGVLHQIRCTLAALGWPIVGDPIYGARSHKLAPEPSRLALHAWKLELPTAEGEILRAEAPMPKDWPLS